ncbi:hypothetical protein F8388_008114 [Cannabis sativa]|uniref:Uncharacterized protein n=1 Tax=Cannabis sativa TaxID=3483 RepID=A0A7J6EX17_CANSA|nr:hypothetical protein F8388_008114 [Cannabis sativa]KAF4391233.1 hypothetical protein G4B88_016543 [Cannabis sativa]
MAAGGCNLKVSFTTDFNIPIKKTQRWKHISKCKPCRQFHSFLHNIYEVIMITSFLAKGSPSYDAIRQTFQHLSKIDR